MRRQGVGTTTIADQVGVSKQRVWQVITESVADRAEEIREHADVLRAEMARTAENALASLAPGIEAGDPAAHRAAQGWLDRLAKLQGLDLQRERSDGPQVVVIDARMPWERAGDVVDGQVVEPPAIDPGDAPA